MSAKAKTPQQIMARASTNLKEVRVEIRLKNNRLILMRERMGLTQLAAAKLIGVVCAEAPSSGILGDYEALRSCPTHPRKGWKPTAIKIAKFYDVDPLWLFSEVVQQIRVPIKTLELGAAEVLALQTASERHGDPSLQIEQTQKNTAVQKAIAKTLSPREEQIIRKRFGLDIGAEPMTYSEIADLCKISVERARQIERRALRRLRSARSSKQELKKAFDTHELS